ncbi:MAG TPA: hypothetical protein VD927_17410, partial [Chryseosolibacter sp.]|nr:hypothetical protein [Chryseosolibacter sp.]
MNITKLFFLILFLGSLNVYAQWNPNGATSGNIYYNGGNVGIGTSSPQAALHVKGQLMIPEATDVSGASPGFIGYVGSEFLHDGVYLNNYGFGYHRYDDGFGWNGLNAYVSGYYGIDFFTGATSRIRINR